MSGMSGMSGMIKYQTLSMSYYARLPRKLKKALKSKRKTLPQLRVMVRIGLFKIKE